MEILENVIVQEAECIIDNQNNKDLEYQQTYSLHIPEPEEQVILRKSIVTKIKTECKKVKENKFPYAEVFLAISSLFLGAFLGALTSQITYELKFLSILYYTISPTAGVGFFVAYIFCRKKENEDVSNFANKIEEYLSDIDDINNINGGEKNEY